ncbi:hypothetical protein HDU93_004989 [Gonapodya sp. JEL0774]|nr:hypothetical protein HDU93_004989 [Gonapodya sp. JEL0774]
MDFQPVVGGEFSLPGVPCINGQIGAPMALTAAGQLVSGGTITVSVTGGNFGINGAGTPSAATQVLAATTKSPTAPAATTLPPSSTGNPGATQVATPPPTGAAGDCFVKLPPNALSATGLSTPWIVSGNGCTQTADGMPTFAECTIVDPATGKLFTYSPLLINQGQAFVTPVVPKLPANGVVGCWFGTNGATTNLIDGNNGKDLAAANCVNGDPGVKGDIFGQFAACNGAQFFAAANKAPLTIPALGTGKNGKPCYTTRSFEVVDMDQSDNVITTYSLDNNGKIGQKTTANSKTLTTDINNGSDNLLLDLFLRPALAPIALIPGNNPMVVSTASGAMSKTKQNAYRAAVDQGTGAGTTAEATAYCQNYLDVNGPSIITDSKFTIGFASPDTGNGNSLYTFLGQRFEASWTGLGCDVLLTKVVYLDPANKLPIIANRNADGVTTSLTFNTAQLLSMAQAAGLVTGGGKATTVKGAKVTTTKGNGGAQGYGIEIQTRPVTKPATTKSAAPATTQVTTPPPTGAAGDCFVKLPPNALSATGLSTPWIVSGNGCTQTADGMPTFAECTIVDPATGKLFTYSPLLINQGQAFVTPVVPKLPANGVVGCWFGTNGATTNLIDGNNGKDLAAANCVNGDPGVKGDIFGQFAACNGAQFFAAANKAPLTIPALGTGKNGKPCYTTRSFEVVDMDQSDNVITTYSLDNNGKIGQKTTANSKTLTTDINNGSDNLLLDLFLRPALGCTAFTAPSLADPAMSFGSLALNELQAAKLQQAPIALIPGNNPMVVSTASGAMSKTKQNAYRAAVDQGTGAGTTAEATAYCQNYLDVNGPSIITDSKFTIGFASPDTGNGNSLYTFLGQRFEASWTGLGCDVLLTKVVYLDPANKLPIIANRNADGVTTSLTFNTAQLLSMAQAAGLVTGGGKATTAKGSQVTTVKGAKVTTTKLSVVGGGTQPTTAKATQGSSTKSSVVGGGGIATTVKGAKPTTTKANGGAQGATALISTNPIATTIPVATLSAVSGVTPIVTSLPGGGAGPSSVLSMSIQKTKRTKSTRTRRTKTTKTKRTKTTKTKRTKTTVIATVPSTPGTTQAVPMLSQSKASVVSTQAAATTGAALPAQSSTVLPSLSSSVGAPVLTTTPTIRQTSIASLSTSTAAGQGAVVTVSPSAPAGPILYVFDYRIDHCWTFDGAVFFPLLTTLSVNGHAPMSTLDGGLASIAMTFTGLKDIQTAFTWGVGNVMTPANTFRFETVNGASNPGGIFSTMDADVTCVNGVISVQNLAIEATGSLLNGGAITITLNKLIEDARDFTSTDDIIGELGVFSDRTTEKIRSFMENGSQGELAREKVYEIVVDWLVEPFNFSGVRELENLKAQTTCCRLASGPFDPESAASKDVAALVNIFIDQIDSLAPAHLPHFGNRLIESLGRSSSHPLLISLIPRTVFWISRQKKLPFEGKEETSAKIRDNLISQACSLDWARTDRAPQWAEAMRDVELTGPQLEKVAKKLLEWACFIRPYFFSLNAYVNPIDTPTVQSSLNSLEQTSPRPLIPPHLVCRQLRTRRERELSLYDNADERDDGISERQSTEERIAQAEGTALLHVGFALRADKDLATDFLKHMRVSRARDLDPFALALLFVMARSSRFAEEVNDCLRSAIITTYRDEEHAKRASWTRISTVINESAPTPPLTAHLLALVRLTARGWDFSALQSLASFLLVTLDDAGAQSVRSKDPGIKKRVTETVTTVLEEVFDHHELIRPHLLDEIVARIKDGGVSASLFAELLGRLIERAPDAFLEHIGRLQEILSHLPVIPPVASVVAISSLRRILNLRPGFRDQLVLSLRKCLGARDVSARLTAVSGLLYLVELVETKVASRYPTEVAFQVEAIGAVRKAMDSQPEVRVALYRELEGLVVRNPRLAPLVIEALWNQLSKYIHDTHGDAGAAIAIVECVADEQDEAHIIEPIPYLLRTVTQSMVVSAANSSKVDAGSGFVKLVDAAQHQLQSLLHNLGKAELADFELDKMVDFNIATRNGVRNLMMASLLLGCYEVMIEYNFSMRNNNHSFEDCTKLFKRHSELVDIIKDRLAKAKDKESNQPRSKIAIGEVSYFSFGFLSRYISFAMSRKDSVAASAVRTTPLTRHVLSSTRKRLHSLSSDGKTDEMAEAGLGQAIVELVSALEKDIWSELAQQTEHAENKENTDHMKDTKEKGKKVPSVENIDLFCESIRVIVADHPDSFENLLSTLGWRSGKPWSFDEGIDESLIQLTKILSSLLTLPSPTKEALRLVEKLCREHSLEDAVFAKNIVTLLLSTARAVDHGVDVVNQLLKDLHLFVGDSEEDEHQDSSVQFAIVNETTSSGVMNAILADIDDSVAEAEWVSTHLKSSKDGPQHQEAIMDMEARACNRLQNQAITLSSLLRCHLPKATREPILKTLKHLFVAVVGVLRAVSFIFYSLMFVSCLSSSPSGVFDQKKNTEKSPEAEPEHISLIEQMGNLSSDVYNVLVTLLSPNGEEDAGGQKRKKSSGRRNKKSDPEKLQTMRESKLVPGLIFEIERFDKETLKLGKKSKVRVNFTVNENTARDFKLERQKLVTITDDEDESAASEGEAEDGNGLADDGDRAKKRRR